MKKETTHAATSFYVDCTFAVTAGIAGAILAPGSVVASFFGAVLAFYGAVLIVGFLHRFGVSPGQLIFGPKNPAQSKSVLSHVVMFGSGVTMTLLFAIGCALISIVRPMRTAF